MCVDLLYWLLNWMLVVGYMVIVGNMLVLGECCGVVDVDVWVDIRL